jgi:polyhydroxyalkanoate synthase
MNTVDRISRWLTLVSGEARVPIATTPRDVIYTRDKLTLYKYRRDTPARHGPPILLVYSLINRPSILDLLPKRSVVKHLLDRGFDVYLIDWGVPDAMDREAGLDVYVNLLLRTAVRQACLHSGHEKITLFGYCMGGTLAAMYAALHPRRVAKLLLLGAPFRFRSEELLYQWSGSKCFRPSNIVDACGNVPVWAFEGFTLLKINEKPRRLVELYEKLDDPGYVESYVAMEQWVNDNIPMAGRVYAEFVEHCFKKDGLLDGSMEIAGKKVDLAAIQCPTLIVAGGKDHLVPPEVSTPVERVIPQAETILFPSGHIGLSVSGGAHKNLWPRVCDWLAGDATTVQQTDPRMQMEAATK